MAGIFGTEVNAKMFLPKSSATWEIADIIKSGQYDNALLLSFSMQDREIIDVRRCFKEITHIFAFGRDPTRNIMQVSILIFLFNKCNTEQQVKISDLVDKYEQNRIYTLAKGGGSASKQITIDDTTVNGFLVDMSVGDVNPSTKTCVVNFTFLLDQGV